MTPVYFLKHIKWWRNFNCLCFEDCLRSFGNTAPCHPYFSVAYTVVNLEIDTSIQKTGSRFINDRTTDSFDLKPKYKISLYQSADVVMPHPIWIDISRRFQRDFTWQNFIRIYSIDRRFSFWKNCAKVLGWEKYELCVHVGALTCLYNCNTDDATLNVKPQ